MFILANTESSGFDRSPNNDLELSTYETHSIDENVEPQSGPWYRNPIKRKWFTYGVIVTLIVVIIIVSEYHFNKNLKLKGFFRY